jgi:hypothetical protein
MWLEWERQGMCTEFWWGISCKTSTWKTVKQRKYNIVLVVKEVSCEGKRWME